MNSVTTSVVLVLVGALLGAGGMYYYLSAFDPAKIERLKIPGTLSSATTPLTQREGVLYENERYHFSLRYPKGLVVKEFDDGNDSFTVVFQKPGAQIGFQIYITPHPEDTISGETILRDVPSGVVNDLKEEQITKDILAATFWSEAPLTGRNREVWFLKNGYLFEFTAYAGEEGAERVLDGVFESLMFK